MADSRKKRRGSGNISRIIIDDAEMDSNLKFKIEEAYKSIRANIMFSVVKKGCKVIVVSSSLPGEGKTTTTVNLAVSVSQADQRVLLIDGDLRKPKIHQYFSVPSSPGLTNYLSDTISGKRKIDIFGVIHPTKFENLSIMCSGTIPPNPAELLGSDFMRDFLDDVSRDFDFIIIDTPPINIVSDALPLIRESDGVVLIVRSNQSTYPDLQRALSALSFIDAKILGFVVNFAETKAGKKKGGYGLYSYSSYSRYIRRYVYTYSYGNNEKYGDYNNKYNRRNR